MIAVLTCVVLPSAMKLSLLPVTVVVEAITALANEAEAGDDQSEWVSTIDKVVVVEELQEEELRLILIHMKMRIFKKK